MNYYNDNDPGKAAWLRNLVVAGLIPQGDVDERSIRDIRAADLDGYAQCHFFAGVGGWALALALAGWPPDRHVWTGSCPCQPFSSAGKRQGEADERHLWPEFARLIGEYRPDVVFGEQVDSPDGIAWLDGVQADLEALDYASGAVVLPAASVGAPHGRHRIFWVAESAGARRQASSAGRGSALLESGAELRPAGRGDAGSRLADAGAATGSGDDVRARQPDDRRGGRLDDAASDGAGRADAPISSGDGPDDGLLGSAGADDRLGHTKYDGCNDAEVAGSVPALVRESGHQQPERPDGTPSWSAYEIVWCDEREFGRGFVPRRAEPGVFPLAPRLPAKLGPSSARGERLELVAAKANRQLRLAGYGDAIVPEVAAMFIVAFSQGFGASRSARDPLGNV